MQNKAATLIVMSLLANTAYAKQGDVDGYINYKLTHIYENTFTKECRYGFDKNNNDFQEGKSVKERKKKPTRFEEKLYEATGNDVYITQTIYKPGYLRTTKGKVVDGGLLNRALHGIEKKVTRLQDCPERVQVIYNELTNTARIK